MAGVRAIIEILANADLITEDDGKLIAADKSNDTENVFDENGSITQQPELTKAVDQIIHKDEIRTTYRSNNFTVNIQIRLDIKPDDLDGLGSKLRQFLSDLSEKDIDNKHGDPE